MSVAIAGVIPQRQNVCRCHGEVSGHSQYRYRTGTCGQQRVEEVADRVDFTRDRTVVDCGAGDRGKVAITTDRRTDRGGLSLVARSNSVVAVAAPRRPDQPDHAATPMMTLFSSASCRRRCRRRGVHRGARPYRYVGAAAVGGPAHTRRRPIDTVDRPRAPQPSEICKAKRLLGLDALRQTVMFRWRSGVETEMTFCLCR